MTILALKIKDSQPEMTFFEPLGAERSFFFAWRSLDDDEVLIKTVKKF